MNKQQMLQTIWPHVLGVLAVVAVPLVGSKLMSIVHGYVEREVDDITNRIHTEKSKLRELKERLAVGAEPNDEDDLDRLRAVEGAVNVGRQVENDPLAAIQFVSELNWRANDYVNKTLHLIMIGAGSATIVVAGALAELQPQGVSGTFAMYALVMFVLSLVCSFATRFFVSLGTAFMTTVLGIAVKPPVAEHTREVVYRLLQTDLSSKSYETAVGILSYSAILYLLLGLVAAVASIGAMH